MSEIVTRSQVTLLAQILGAEPERLAGLERLGAPAVRAILERVSNLLFDEHAQTFHRIAKLAPLIPTSVAAKVALKAIPPEVGGRAGGTIGRDHPDKAAALMRDLTTEYMADSAPFLDPRAIPVLVTRIPSDALIPAANLLMKRRDYATTAMFIEQSTEELIREFERGIDDDEGLLHTAAQTFSTDRMNEIVRVLSPQRRIRIVNSSIHGDDDTLLAGLSVLARLDRDLADTLGNAYFAALDDDAIARVLEVASTANAMTEILVVSDALSDATLRHIATNPAAATDSTRDAIVRAATTPRLRRAAATIASFMPEPAHSTLGEALGSAI